MIDITTLQTFPIPQNIINIQQSNILLKGENEVFKDLIFTVVLLGGAYMAIEFLDYLNDEIKKFPPVHLDY